MSGIFLRYDPEKGACLKVDNIVMETNKHCRVYVGGKILTLTAQRDGIATLEIRTNRATSSVSLTSNTWMEVMAECPT